MNFLAEKENQITMEELKEGVGRVKGRIIKRLNKERRMKLEQKHKQADKKAS